MRVYSVLWNIFLHIVSLLQSAESTAGELPENVPKNRYKDILPYDVSACGTQNDYSELPLIWTPEMRPPLYWGHFKMYQSMLPDANLPLKWGHPSNQDTLTGPKGGRIRGSPLYWWSKWLVACLSVCDDVIVYMFTCLWQCIYLFVISVVM